MKRFALALLLSVCAASGWAESYLGGAGFLSLPQGGGDARRRAGGTVRAGAYLSDFWSVEAQVGCAEDAALLGAGFLGHWTGLELYDRFFGFSAFDPFVTLGAKGLIGGTGEVGPSIGLGAFYHLGEVWSLRADVDATLDLNRELEMVYQFSVGLQYTF